MMKIAFIAVLVLMVIAAAILLPLEQILLTIQGWANNYGPWAMVALAGLFALNVILLLPTSPMVMLAGFLFGLPTGLAVVWLGGLAGSSIAFALGRGTLRKAVERRMRSYAIFAAIDRASERKGLLIVLLTRLVMVVPYQVLNYALGLTRVSLRDYLVGTNLGMIPPFVLFVFLGTTASNVAAIMAGELNLSRDEWLVATAIFVVVIAVVLLLIRSASRVLREELTSGSESLG